MADDIAKLGLDTGDIERSTARAANIIEKRLGGAANRADKEVKGLHASLTKMGKAAIAFFGFQSLRAGANAIIRLNADIEATRAKLVAGSREAKDFEDAVAGIGENQANAFHEAERFLDNLTLKLKGMAAKSVLGLGMLFGSVKPENVFKKDSGSSSMEEIRKLQDKQAANASAGGDTVQDRIDALNEELHIQFKLHDYYQEGVGMDRERLNSTKLRIGALLNELSVTKRDFELSEASANAERRHILFTQEGYRHVGEQQAIIAQYEEKIAQARKEGRKELEAQLNVQRNIAVEQAKADRARETPATRREARREVARRRRDARRDDARQAEFERRSARGAVGGSGSPLAEFQMGVARKDAGNGGGMAGVQATLNKIEKNTQGSLVVSAQKGG